MSGPFQSRCDERINIHSRNPAGIQNELAGPDMVAGIAVAEQTFSDIERQDQKYRYEDYVSERRQ